MVFNLYFVKSLKSAVFDEIALVAYIYLMFMLRSRTFKTTTDSYIIKLRRTNIGSALHYLFYSNPSVHKMVIKTATYELAVIEPAHKKRSVSRCKLLKI